MRNIQPLRQGPRRPPWVMARWGEDLPFIPRYYNLKESTMSRKEPIMPQCQICQAQTPEDECHEHAGQVLCDDCYMDALNPAKSCDPWATYTASRLPDTILNPLQERIMALLKERGEVTPQDICSSLEIPAKDLEREFASLRHMQLTRAKQGPGGSKLLTTF